MLKGLVGTFSFNMNRQFTSKLDSAPSAYYVFGPLTLQLLEIHVKNKSRLDELAELFYLYLNHKPKHLLRPIVEETRAVPKKYTSLLIALLLHEMVVYVSRV
jgi:hypothetical protein